ncbi:FtsX-like permease family protein [Candidatus Bathyarchaeota archaeon]|nr:FtsX-like permease family protein [Candidatus Bathyarchaeota archaeon]
MDFSQRLAINRGFRVWASTENGVFLCQLAGYFEGKGLPVIIPWIIVMLNVVITMLNSYYERSKEVMIYSSIGMNPRQISTIFLGEAGVVGLVGGSLGYILGLGAYKFIYLVTPSLQVEQKVSAAWSLAAIGLSLTAVLVGGVVALLNSTNITPSLIRRWRANKAERRTDSFVIELPVEVFEEELDKYISFLEEELYKSSKGFNFSTKMIKKKEENGGWIFEFVYSNTGTSISTVYTKNRLIIEKNDGGQYLTRLECVGDENGAQAAGSLMRKIGLGWSLSRSDRSKTSIIQDGGDL